MKRIVVFCCLSICSAISWGQTRNLTISPSSLDFAIAGEQKSVSVTSNTNWWTVNTASWLTVGPGNGSNNGRVTITAEANTSTTKRTATVSVQGTGVVGKTISVTQEARQQQGVSRTWNLSPTMRATLVDGTLTVSTSRDLEAMPNRINPWYDFREELFTVIIEDNITSIGASAFTQCRNLTYVTIGNSVTSIEDGAFSNCYRLFYIPIPNSVKTIGATAFYYCIGLTSIEIPNSVTSIGHSAFGRSGLTSIEIPNSVTSIGSWAFDLCTDLTSIKIPKSVISIGEHAFGYMHIFDKLKDITVEWNTPLPVPANVFGGFTEFSNITLYVPAGTKSLYQATTPWNFFKTIVEYNSTNIGHIEVSTLNAYASNGILYISGIHPSKPISIYSVSGQLVYSGIAKAETEQIPLNIRGIYLIMAGNQSIKTIIK